MNNFCIRCGAQLNPNDKYCGSCGYPISNDTLPNVNSNGEIVDKNGMTSEETRKANILTIIAILAEVAASAISVLLSYISTSLAEKIGPLIVGVAPFISLGFLVYVRVKYPNHLFSKIVVWLYIALLIIAIIGALILMIACYSMVDAVRGCQG